MAGLLVREARRRVGLTQAELAVRAGTTQSAVARVESGRTSPSWDTVVSLIRACGLDLLVEIVERDGSDWDQAERLLALTPAERVARHVDGVRSAAAFERASWGAGA